MQFLSPTVNMYIPPNDFLKFISNPEYYLNAELEFIDSDKSYPVAKLNDITLYCNHYTSAEEVNTCWSRRKKELTGIILSLLCMILNQLQEHSCYLYVILNARN